MLFYDVRKEDKGYEAVFISYAIGRVSKFIPVALRDIVSFPTSGEGSIHSDVKQYVVATGWKDKIYRFDSDPGKATFVGFDPWTWVPEDFTHQVLLTSIVK